MGALLLEHPSRRPGALASHTQFGVGRSAAASLSGAIRDGYGHRFANLGIHAAPLQRCAADEHASELDPTNGWAMVSTAKQRFLDMRTSPLLTEIPRFGGAGGVRTAKVDNLLAGVSDDLALSAVVDIERPAPPEVRTAYMTDQGDAPDESQVGEDEIFKAADIDGGDGGDGGDMSAASTGLATALATGTCTYGVTYANQRTLGCGARCGAKIQFDITGITANGDCPPLVPAGTTLTEDVTTDNGCGPGSVTTGAGCPIAPDGTIPSCTDTYGLCLPPASVPGTGCTEVYTQRLWITPPGTSGGTLAETRHITFVLTKTGAGCSGTVTRT
jgi:hypothetical protein